MSNPRVLILMGSANDWPVMQGVARALDELGVGWEAHVSSAHRTPERTAELVGTARERGFGVLVCGAGMAAHLAGVAAAETTLPVIAVPIASGSLQGLDALLSSVQMPPGIPVATVAVGGGRNAGILAAQMLSLGDASLIEALAALRKRMKEKVEGADQQLQEELARERAGGA